MKIDTGMTELIAKNKFKEAFKDLAEVLFSEQEQIKSFNELVEKDPEYVFHRLFNSAYTSFISDMKIENEACHNLNYTELLKTIESEVLLIGGTKDKYFSVDEMRTTEQLIKSSRLILLDGKAHGELLSKDSIEAVTKFVVS